MQGAIELFDCLDRKPLKLQTYYIKGKHLLNDVPSHTINYGHIIDPESKEVVGRSYDVCVKSAKTFTREDIIEINCHGGILTINRVLELL